ncbi:MAG: hypothetical protein CSA81_11205 [Acidobacteria bacterium]|nr:MAG: hypothetical protein CSA81_11205 [Acidobacteriota bacterium]
MKVRIRKPLADGRHLKKGVITVENEGRVYYRLPCEACGKPLKLRNAPVEGDNSLCKECQNIADIGKPETILVRKRGSYDYETPCDQCGKLERTSFLPKRSREFLCNDCLRESRQEQTAPAKKPGENPATEATSTSEKTHAPGEVNASLEMETPSREALQPMHRVKCSKCRKYMQLRFKPRSPGTFICPKCYEKRQEERRSEKPETKILYNIECDKCGKSETLNFIPSYPDRALCSSCFAKIKRR